MAIVAIVALSIYIGVLLIIILQSYRKDRQEKRSERNLEIAAEEATQLIHGGDPGRAVALLAPLHDARPYDEAVGLKLAAACTLSGDAERATRICRWFLVSSPESFEFLYQLGEARRAADDLTGAREAYERALAANSQHLGTYRRLSEIYRRQGRIADLKPLWQKAVASLPNGAESRAAVAEAFGGEPV
jgi:tetratricopeptide (TPR) repeat protein